MSEPRMLSSDEYGAMILEHGMGYAAKKSYARMIEIWRHDFGDKRSDSEISDADDGPFGDSPASQQWRKNRGMIASKEQPR